MLRKQQSIIKHDNINPAQNNWKCLYNIDECISNNNNKNYHRNNDKLINSL